MASVIGATGRFYITILFSCIAAWYYGLWLLQINTDILPMLTQLIEEAVNATVVSQAGDILTNLVYNIVVVSLDQILLH